MRDYAGYDRSLDQIHTRCHLEIYPSIIIIVLLLLQRVGCGEFRQVPVVAGVFLGLYLSIVSQILGPRVSFSRFVNKSTFNMKT